MFFYYSIANCLCTTQKIVTRNPRQIRSPPQQKIPRFPPNRNVHSMSKKKSRKPVQNPCPKQPALHASDHNTHTAHKHNSYVNPIQTHTFAVATSAQASRKDQTNDHQAPAKAAPEPANKQPGAAAASPSPRQSKPPRGYAAIQ